MDKKIVKNVSDQELAVVGIGLVKSGETVEVPADFHNANFEDVVRNEPKTETKKDSKRAKEDEEEKSI